MMRTLYKQTPQEILYWQGWVHKRTLTVNAGIVGSEGTVTDYKLARRENPNAAFEKATAAAFADGFLQLDSLPEQIIVQQPAIGDEKAMSKHIDALSFQLNNLIGWHGGGFVDGFDIGSGTLNIFIDTISSNRIVPVILKYLEETGQLNSTIVATREYVSDEITVHWPNDFVDEFAY